MVDPEYELGILGRIAAVGYGIAGYATGAAATALAGSVNPVAGAVVASYFHHHVGKRFKAAITGDARDWFGHPPAT